MKFFYFILLVFVGKFCFAQEVPVTTQQQLEDIVNATEDERKKDESYLLQLDYFKKHPVNLNVASAEELQALLFLTDLQINNLLRYRNLLGKFIDVYELQAIPGWDLFTIKKIISFITIGPAVSLNEDFFSRFNGDQNLLFRVTRTAEKQKGYDTSLNTHYLGDRNHLLMRYRYQYKDLLYLGVVADKDAGEQFFKGAQTKGFDFYSVHFFAKRLGSIKALAIGDYTVNLGQGLIQWQSLAFGKSSDVMSIKRQSPVLVPYRSAGEFYFNRGVGITIQKKNLEATFFASYKKISGNIISDSAERVSSLLTSGYYRTPSEIADRYKVAQTSLGGNISYQNNSFKIGLNTVAHQFDIPLQRRDAPYNYFSFSGRNLFNTSVDYSYTFRNIHLFGEAASDKNFHKAFINGALISADPKVDISFLYRNIQKEYQSLYGNAFTENTLPVNEKGFYSDISLRPFSFWQMNAYADFYQFPWLRYGVSAPSRGYDYAVQLSYQPNKQFELYVRFKNKKKPIDTSGNGTINYPEDVIKQSLLIHFFDQISRSLSVKSRVEIVWYDKRTKKEEEGYLIYIEAGYNGFKKINSNLRLQYFETNSYNSRIYAYESDVLYSYSIPAFFNKGFHYYFNLNYDLNKKFSFWLRWAQSVFKNLNKIGSGLDEIQGNVRSEIKLQLLFKW